MQYLSAADAVRHVQSGQRVFLHGSAATPHSLIKALLTRRQDLKNVELISVSTLGNELFDVANFGDSFYLAAGVF
ncbi:MAG: hypothetical protein AAFO94_17290 [Bacteroidota bacterium]